MAAVEKLGIALTLDLTATNRQGVASGGYASASKVMREALRDWQARQAVGQGAARELCRLWDEGLAIGPAVPLDMAAVTREARLRHG